MDTDSGPKRLHSHIHLLEFKATFQGLCGWQSQITTCSSPMPCVRGPPSSFALSFLAACTPLILPNCRNYTLLYFWKMYISWKIFKSILHQKECAMLTPHLNSVSGEKPSLSVTYKFAMRQEAQHSHSNEQGRDFALKPKQHFKASDRIMWACCAETI